MPISDRSRKSSRFGSIGSIIILFIDPIDPTLQVGSIIIYSWVNQRPLDSILSNAVSTTVNEIDNPLTPVNLNHDETL